MSVKLSDVLGRARVYSAFAAIVGAERARTLYVQQYIRPSKGDRVLDLGCGPADILDALPEVSYHGVDQSREYIDRARRRFGTTASFEVIDVADAAGRGFRDFDLVLATGVVHHLDDGAALALFRLAHDALKENGALVTLDGCFENGQSTAARWLLRRDRGSFVRTRLDYERLARAVFDDVECHVRHNLLRIPYTHLIMRCTRHRGA